MAAADPPELPAGAFGRWLAGFERGLADATGTDVPCGACTACCTSSQFVHIEPDETDALDHIPSQLLFPAPRLPPGHVLLGFDDRGHCPMLVDGACSIYEHRPRTCRTYDCRVLAAAGIELVEPTKAGIAEQARRWRFDHPTDQDTVAHLAVQAARAHLEAHSEVLPEGAPGDATAQRAVLAISIHRTFVGRDEATDRPVVLSPSSDAVRVAITQRASRLPPQ